MLLGALGLVNGFWVRCEVAGSLWGLDLWNNYRYYAESNGSIRARSLVMMMEKRALKAYLP